MLLSEFIPIALMIILSIFCIAIAVILSIRSKKSVFNIDTSDFIDKLVDSKKRSLNANLGGLNWKEYITLLVVSPICSGILSYLFLNTKSLCVIFIGFGLLVPEIIILLNSAKYKRKFEERYAMALRALASSLRAGRTIEQSIEDVGNNPFIESHIRDGFRQILSDIKVGKSIEYAFKRFADDSHNDDAYDVAAAITMQSKLGGSEAAVISNIAQNINDRIMTRKEIKTMFAETDILILVMDFLPFIIIGIFYLFVPELIDPLLENKDTATILIAVLCFIEIGSFIIHKIADKAKGG